MIDCNITVNFLKEWERMHEVCKRCEACPLSCFKNSTGNSCRIFAMGYPQEAQKIVQKWSNEHPIKTRQEAFLEAFPNALIRGTGVPESCAKIVGIAPNGDCREKSCVVCWNEPYEEQVRI